MDDTELSGIYSITSPTGRVYIGQALNLKRRLGVYTSIREAMVTTGINPKACLSGASKKAGGFFWRYVN